MAVVSGEVGVYLLSLTTTTTTTDITVSTSIKYARVFFSTHTHLNGKVGIH